MQQHVNNHVQQVKGEARQSHKPAAFNVDWEQSKSKEGNRKMLAKIWGTKSQALKNCRVTHFIY